MKIVFPEIENEIIVKAVEQTEGVEAVSAEGLTAACEMVARGEAEAIIAGIEYESAEVLKTCRDIIGASGRTFSSSMVMTREAERLVVADVATNKSYPTAERLVDVILQTYETARKVLADEPRVAVLAYSTLGSGGDDAALEMLREAVATARERRPEMMIDGELQLDAAVNSIIGTKKAPESAVAGRANVLICPDLNAGNILYKALEQYGGFSAAGPILQGFNAPAADLSRGSSVRDVIETIEIIKKLVEE